jgi:tetratricopeptide (TPR) repeat protein
MGVEQRGGSQALTSAGQRAPRGWLLLLLSLLAVAGVYLPALGGPFLWDDRHLIPEGTAPQAVDIKRAFTQPFWFGSSQSQASVSYFRPLTTLSLDWDRSLHGDVSAGYHLTNVAAHLLAMGLLFALLRRRVSELVAFVVALGWALLPRLTEDAAWISGRGDVLAGALALGALWVHRPGSSLRLALAALLALGSSWCKEAGVAAFAALLVLELAGASAGRAKPLSPRLGLLLGPLLLYGASRFWAGAGSMGDGQSLGLAQRSITVLEALGRYAFMLANPFQPRSVIGQLGAPSWPFVVLGGGVALTAALVALRRPKLSPETTAYLVLGVTPLLLVLHVAPLPVTAVAADRYLYLPSAGLLLALAPALQGALSARRSLWAPLALLVLALGVRTSQRVDDYADDARFWIRALEQAPRDVTPAVELGGVAYRSGCFKEALALYSRAAKLDSAPVSRQLATVALIANDLGQRDLAGRALEELMRAYPRLAEMRLRRATLAVSSLDWEGAQEHARQALQLEPGFAAARAFIDSLPKLQALHHAVLAGAPASVRLTLEMRSMRYPEAVATLRGLLDDPRADPAALRRGLEFVVTRGTPEDAAELLERYLRASPDSNGARLNVAAQVRSTAAESLRAQLRQRAVDVSTPR